MLLDRQKAAGDGNGKRKAKAARNNASKGKKPRNDIKKWLLGFLGGPDDDGGTRSRFEITVGEMVEQSGAVVMGRVHMVNLRDLIIKRSENPEETLERAETIAEAVINEHLDEGDVFAHGEEGAFYLLFPGLSEEAGELKCAVIGDQIARLLAAEDPIFFKLEITNTVGTVDRKNLKDAMAEKSDAEGSFDPADIQRRVQETREKKRMEQAIASATPREKMAPDKDIPAVPDEDAEKTEPAAARPPPEGMSVMYGTIWNVKTKLLTAYSCNLMVREADGRTVRFKLKHRAEHHRRTLLAIDRYTQRKATARLSELLQSGQETLVVLPVHFMTMDQDTSSLLYRQGLADLSEAERRHIVLELVDLPPDLPGIRIGQTIRTMRRFARTVMARVPIDIKNLDSWHDTGVHAVGFDLGTLRMDQQALLPKLERFAETAEESGLRKFVYGLDTISSAAMAVAAGFDYTEGEAVCAPVESIEHVRPFETEDLLAHHQP
jgi:hypothetical protein